METKDENINSKEIFDVRTALIKESIPNPDIEGEWEKFKAKKIIAKSDTKRNLTWLFSGMAIGGAAAAVICFLILWPFATNSDKPFTIFEAVEQDNNIKLFSSNAADSFNSVTEITKDGILDLSGHNSSDKISDQNNQRTVTTPRGKNLKIVLDDGTEVLLHAESQLTFPDKFSGITRTVHLQGEAYFTVAKDSAHPFIVKSMDLSTTALGTEFNVKAYNKDNIKITLVEGSVLVNDGSGNNSVVLAPGEDVCNINGKLVVSAADVKSFAYWKEGFFYFDNVPLVDVLIELGRWYNVNIELRKRSLMSYRLHFTADRNSSIEDAIERLNHFSYLKVELKDRVLIVDDTK